MIYLDHAATSPLSSGVKKGLSLLLKQGFYNPSSSHFLGQNARDMIEESRASLADLVYALPEHIFFTSGGSEANSLVLQGYLKSLEIKHIISSTIEHSSVLKTLEALERQNIKIEYLQPNSEGSIELEKLKSKKITQHTLVSIQMVNNETGVILPVERFAKWVKECGGFFHTDIAQALGKCDVHFLDSAIDFMSCTAHKIRGPQGVGALITKYPKKLTPFIFGGTQERGKRGGTENLMGISGFGMALKEQSSHSEIREETLKKRLYFERILCQKIPNASIICSQSERAPHISNIRFKGVDGQALFARLDLREIYVSQSSACTNMKPEPSYVLRAIGLSEDEAYQCIRFSFSNELTFQDLDYVINTLFEILKFIQL